MVPQSIVGCAVRATLVTLFPLAMLFTAAETVSSQPSALRFEVRLGRAPNGKLMRPHRPAIAPSGRLLVVLGKPGTDEPRLSVGQTGKNASPILGRDVDEFEPDAVAVLDNQSAIFPIASLSQLRPGTYAIQALLHTNLDLNLVNAPGDLYSPVTTARLDPAAGGTIKLELTRAVPAEVLPADQELVKYLKIHSPLLSDFHGRPIALRAGVILPPRLSTTIPRNAIRSGFTSAATAHDSPRWGE